ncbi:MAG: TIGR02147 family protein [Bacteriovoracaceae bacterium]
MNSETWLKNRLEEKLQKNPAFSLRAFARLIKLSPSYLSRVLSGERKLTFKAATIISESLALNPQEKKTFYDLVLNDQSTQPSKKISQKKEEINQNLELTLEAFKIVSDWYHYGITQLFFVEGFQDDPTWIAKMLEIRPIEAKFALARLEKLGIIERDKNGKLIRTNTLSPPLMKLSQVV